MTDDYYISCYWSNRTESDDRFAERAAAWFHELSQIDPFLEHWYLRGKSAKTAVEFAPTVDVLRKLFKSRQHNRPGLGVIFGAWNGRDEPDYVSTNMNAAWVAGSFPATCGIRPPWKGEFAERFLTAGTLARVLRAMARVWDPDWGVAMSHEYLATFADPAGQLPPGGHCGWMTYLARRQGVVPPLPPPVRVEPVEDRGTLIILTPEHFTASNPSHVALGKEVQRILDQAGLTDRLL